MQSKREQIIGAALRQYRTAGVGATTLKDVALASGVPLGNLYYYFKTRDELVLAVLDACELELQMLLDRLAPRPPRDWLAGYFAWLLADPQGAAELGCPFGSLAVELRALSDPAAPRAAGIVQLYLSAVQARVQALGASAEVAAELFMSIQGAYTVSRVLGDPALFRRCIESVQRRTLTT